MHILKHSTLLWLTHSISLVIQGYLVSYPTQLLWGSRVACSCGVGQFCGHDVRTYPCDLVSAMLYGHTDWKDSSHTVVALSTPPLFNCPRASALVAGGAFRLRFRSSVVKVAISLDFVDGPDCRTAVPLWLPLLSLRCRGC